MNNAVAADSLVADILPATALERLAPQWRDLSRRTEDANPFAEPAFLIPALRGVAPRGLEAACVWETSERRRLLGLAVLEPPRAFWPFASVWCGEQAALPSILVARERPASTLLTMSDAVAARYRCAPGLSISSIEPASALAGSLKAAAALRDIRLVVSNPRRRAALARTTPAAFEQSLDRKRRKEWSRLRRRLEERGELRVSWGADEAAIENFLTLEGSGWKGTRGTALLSAPRRAAFARTMLAAFAAEGRLRVASLRLDGRAIAAGTLLIAGERAFFWKIAFDENYAEFSPGVQLTLAIGRATAVDLRVALADSCAHADHPMIDRIWRNRIELADFVLALPSERPMAFETMIAVGAAGVSLRAAAKRLMTFVGANPRRPWGRGRPTPVRSGAPTPAGRP